MVLAADIIRNQIDIIGILIRLKTACFKEFIVINIINRIGVERSARILIIIGSNGGNNRGIKPAA